MISFDPIKNNLNKKEMTLQEIYKKETGKNPVRKDMLDNYRPSMKYVEWLEEQLTIPVVVGQSEQLSCGRNITTCVFYKDGGKCSNLEYCRDQTT